MALPRTPRPRRSAGQQIVDAVWHLLGKLGRADTALGPAELAAIYLIFVLVGWSVGGTLGDILRPAIGGFGVLLVRLVGAVVALLLVKPVRSIRTRTGYLGIAGAVLLALLVSCGTGSAGQIAALSRQTVAARQMTQQLEKLGSGEQQLDTVAEGPARGCQIAQNAFKTGLATEEEVRRWCSVPSSSSAETEGRAPLQVPGPSPLLFLGELGKLLLAVAIIWIVFLRR